MLRPSPFDDIDIRIQPTTSGMFTGLSIVTLPNARSSFGGMPTVTRTGRAPGVTYVDDARLADQLDWLTTGDLAESGRRLVESRQEAGRR